MLRALVVVPDGSGPGGADGRDLAVLAKLPDAVRDDLSVTVTTPTGGPPAVDEAALAWVKQESEEDWAYLGSLGEMARPTLAALSEGDVRALGLPVCRHLRDGLLRSGVPPRLVRSLLLEVVQAARSRLAGVEEVFLKLCGEETGLRGVDVQGCYDEARAVLESQCRQRAAEVGYALDGLAALSTPAPLEKVATADGGWDVVLVPGGGGQVEALGADPGVGELLAAARRSGAPLGVVGAGAAALLGVDDGIDGWIFDGIVVAAPADQSYSFLADRTWSAESVRNRLLRRGAIVDEAGPDWASRIADDQGVVSGRNSRCATAVYASAIVQARRPG